MKIHTIQAATKGKYNTGLQAAATHLQIILAWEAKNCTILFLQWLFQNFIYCDNFWQRYTSI